MKRPTTSDKFMAEFAEMSPAERAGTITALTIIHQYESAREARRRGPKEPKDDKPGELPFDLDGDEDEKAAAVDTAEKET